MQGHWDLHQETAVWSLRGRSKRWVDRRYVRAPSNRPSPRASLRDPDLSANPVPENLDWKQKYRDSLLEMETEEKRWKDVEQVLRRLIGRLCAAGMGVDPLLDDELTALAAANRRNADALELERLAASLTTAVVTVEATSRLPQGRAAQSAGASSREAGPLGFDLRRHRFVARAPQRPNRTTRRAELDRGAAAADTMPRCRRSSHARRM